MLSATGIPIYKLQFFKTFKGYIFFQINHGYDPLRAMDTSNFFIPGLINLNTEKLFQDPYYFVLRYND